MAQASPARTRETVARWKALFSDPRFPLPDTVVRSRAIDEHGGAVPLTDKKD